MHFTTIHRFDLIDTDEKARIKILNKYFSNVFHKMFTLKYRSSNVFVNNKNTIRFWHKHDFSFEKKPKLLWTISESIIYWKVVFENTVTHKSALQTYCKTKSNLFIANKTISFDKHFKEKRKNSILRHIFRGVHVLSSALIQLVNFQLFERKIDNITSTNLFCLEIFRLNLCDWPIQPRNKNHKYLHISSVNPCDDWEYK